MNELTTTQPAGYVSVFLDPATYDSKIKIAETLSKTQFVPEAFRGKAGDCLVALDMAARLDLNPLAVFSDIYIIDNRASFSSKFLIALVNRSGRFSRIAFDEGIDGEAEVTYSGWGDQRGQRKTWKEKVPNYYAQASFVELASGETFRSPRVDMNFAEKNGWVAKSGSKWQTMPQIMCRYRAASILIKSVCPEIVMGLEWSDDLQDAREERVEPTPRRVEASVSAPRALNPPKTVVQNDMVFEVVDSDEFEAFGAQIAAASSVDDLQAVASGIAHANLTDAQTKTLRRLWSDRKKELARVEPPQLPPVEGLPGETVLNAVALRSAINDATDAAALDDMRGAIANALQANQITAQEEVELLSAISSRQAVLNANPATTEGATDDQLRWADQLRRAIQLAAEERAVDRLRSFRATITEWTDKGYLTPGMGTDLYQELQEALDSLEEECE